MKTTNKFVIASLTHQPSKESVRDWLRSEIGHHRPPPDPKQIRRELGWELIEMQRS